MAHLQSEDASNPPEPCVEFDESSLFAESRPDMGVGEKSKDAPVEDDGEDELVSLPVPDPPTGEPSAPSPSDTELGELPEAVTQSETIEPRRSLRESRPPTEWWRTTSTAHLASTVLSSSAKIPRRF